MLLEEAVKLVPGQVVVFAPIARRSEYVLTSLSLPIQDDVIVPGREYIISCVNGYDADERSVFSRWFADDVVSAQGVSSVDVELEEFEDLFMPEQFSAVGSVSRLSFLQLYNGMNQGQVLPHHWLTAMVGEGNMYDLPIDDYLRYLNDEGYLYRDASERQFVRSIDAPLERDKYMEFSPLFQGKNLAKAGISLQELMSQRYWFFKKTYVLCSAMQEQFGAKTYGDIIYTLRGGGLKESVVQFFIDDNLLCKKEFGCAAKVGYTHLFVDDLDPHADDNAHYDHGE